MTKRQDQDYVTKPSEPDKVDAYMKKLKHPLAEVAEALRKIISSTDSEIGEEIKWNAPAFFYAGEMKPSDPNKYKRWRLRGKPCVTTTTLAIPGMPWRWHRLLCEWTTSQLFMKRLAS